MIRPLLAIALLVPVVAGADDLKLSQLEQDVRELQRQVQSLVRQVEAQRASPTPSVTATAPLREVPRTAADAPPWLDAARWSMIKPGMSELEVVGILGPPTSMRGDASRRQMLYAMEIGASGFLGGSVVLQDRSVVSVNKPTLK